MLKNYDTLIISGGSVNGLAALGALQFLNDQKKLSNIKTFIGTSIGTMINYLLVIGYSPIDIIAKLISEKLLEKYHKINVLNLTKGLGGFDWKHIDDFLIGLTLEKCEQPMTFKDIYDKFGLKFICSTYNMSQRKIEYLSYESTPDLLCTAGIRMSCNLPLIFSRYRYQHNHYVDGGIVDNFSLKYVSNDNCVIAINLTSAFMYDRHTVSSNKVVQIPTSRENSDISIPSNEDSIDTEGKESVVTVEDTEAQRDKVEIDNAVDTDNIDVIAEGMDDLEEFDLPTYILTIIYIPLTQHIFEAIKEINSRDPNNCDILALRCKQTGWNFMMTVPEQLEIFSDGYQKTKQFFNI